MAEKWEQGNAARELSYSDRHNPYKPLDYAARLQNAGKRPSAGAHSASYTPGQLYGRPMTPPKAFDAPPAYDPAYPPSPAPAPHAAPQMETPSYLQPQPSLPPMYAQPMEYRPAPVPQPARRRSQRVQEAMTPRAGAQPGTLYSAALFDHQPTAVMPSGYEETPFASRSTADLPFFSEMPVWPGEAAPVKQPPVGDEMLEDRPWRDPFTPAAPREDEAEKAQKAPKAQPKTRAKKAKANRPHVRVTRVIALAASIVMLLFCLIVGGRLVWELSRNEAQRAEYQERTGQTLQYGAARVDLLPNGQTFVPTATPSPTRYIPLPTPAPIIPIKEAAVLSLGSPRAEGTAPEITAAPVLRTKLKTYPKNPLCNIQPSIAALVKENPDVIGHLVIEGVLDEIVMQRNNTYYLNHSSLGSPSEAGAVFADESCSFRLPPENLLLRGQCGTQGKTFHPLLQYATKGSAFAASAPTAKLTTLYEEEIYELFAVIAADSDPANPGYFNYASHPTFTTDDAMMAYVQEARAHSLYQFNVDVQPSDRLLTLATLGGDDTLVLLYRLRV